MPRIKIKNLPNDLEIIGRAGIKKTAEGAGPTKVTPTMGIQEARRIAEAFVRLIRSQCERVEIVGSIRRGKARVNDIDIVAIPKNPRRFQYRMQSQAVGLGIFVFEFLGAKIDLFLATRQNYGVSKLIRTGSAQFNMRLCLAAKKKGWVLDFTRGLVTDKGEIRTEEAILRSLLGRVPNPRDRK